MPVRVCGHEDRSARRLRPAARGRCFVGRQGWSVLRVRWYPEDYPVRSRFKPETSLGTAGSHGPGWTSGGRCRCRARYPGHVPGTDIDWLSTAAAARRLGITPRTLYRFIDEGELPAYRFGRVIRLKQSDVDAYIERCRIEPGSLDHLYPEPSAQDH